MGLRWRWTLVLAAATAGLMLVAGIGIESTLRARMGLEARAWEQAQSAALGDALLEDGAALESVVGRMLDDPEFAAAFGPATPDDAQLRAREDHVVLLASREALGELLVLDAAGRVLACSIHPARVGTVHPAAAELGRILPRTALVWREEVPGDPAASGWRLSAAREVPLGAGRVRVVASALLDRAALDTLERDLGLAGLHWGPPSAGERLLAWPLGIEAEPGANLALAPGPPPDLRALRSLRIWLLAAVGVALLIGVVGAPWIASGLGAPLLEMSAAMERIGQGSRSVELEPAGPPEVRQLQRSLRRLVRELRETEERVRLAERQATWRELARHIAHEIRNVLSPLSLALDNVETGVKRDGAGLEASLSVARDQLESLRRLASEFGEHARQPEPRLRVLAIADLLDAVAQTARAAFSGLDLRVEPQHPPDSVEGDAEQLRRAVHNLLKNAVEVAPDRPVVLRCGAGPDPDRWWIEVQDRGPGLPPQVEASLGEPQRSTRTGGSGLGLAVVTRVCLAHAGRLVVERPAEGGSVLRMELSRRPGSPEAGARS